MDCGKYGARIERGEVIEVSGLKMRVKSLERSGMVSRSMYSIENTAYEVGSKVFYFQFDDGSGLILGEAYVAPQDRALNN